MQSIYAGMGKTNKNQIGELLRHARRNAELTQGQVAKRLGVSITTIHAYERGGRLITADRLKRLAKTYGVPAADLLGAP